MITDLQPTTEQRAWKAGTGTWKQFTPQLTESIFEAAQGWKRTLAGVERPWLCWNVSSRWCYLQQKLVQAVGWTPVVGFDPRSGPPPLTATSILIDFNETLHLPVLWPHVPLEFAFLFADRLAFWHADLLCRLPVMEHLARLFGKLQDGQLAAVLDRGGRRNQLNFKTHRYWELCGCTTKSASENQFYNGAGWWRFFQVHPKCVLEEERKRRLPYSWDSGAGILYWQKRYNGSVIPIDIALVKEGHCSEIGNKRYKKLDHHFDQMRDLRAEIDLNYSIHEVATRLGIAHLIDVAEPVDAPSRGSDYRSTQPQQP
jgi:hypothetical protein